MEHLGDLIAEASPDAYAAAQAVENALEQVAAAHAAWGAQHARTMALLRLAGQNTGTLADMPQRLTDLVRDMGRACDSVRVPAPLPRDLAYRMTAAPHDTPAAGPREAVRGCCE